MQDAREGSQERGFAEAGDAFEKDVAAGEEADEDAIDDLLLADNNFADFLANTGKLRGG